MRGLGLVATDALFIMLHLNFSLLLPDLFEIFKYLLFYNINLNGKLFN